MLVWVPDRLTTVDGVEVQLEDDREIPSLMMGSAELGQSGSGS